MLHERLKEAIASRDVNEVYHALHADGVTCALYDDRLDVPMLSVRGYGNICWVPRDDPYNAGWIASGYPITERELTRDLTQVIDDVKRLA